MTREVSIISEGEDGKEIIHFVWELTTEQLIKLNDFANDLVEEV